MAFILAREMGVQIRTTSGPAIERPGDLAALLTNLQPNDILFIDEIHRLKPAVEEILYSAMEDFCLDLVVGKGPSARTVQLELPPFTLIAATTRGKTDPAAIAEAGTLAAELVARGLLAEGAARTICTMLTEARRALADARATAPPDPFAEAIQILMPEEWAVVEAYRASRAVPPLKRFSLFCRTRTRT